MVAVKTGCMHLFAGQHSEYMTTRKCPHPLFKEQEMELSARNKLKGKIVEVMKGATTSHVRVDVGQGVIVTASITNEAVAELGLQKGDAVWAVIKASDVMIGK